MLVEGWLQDSGYDLNPVAQAAATKLFDGNDDVECYWTLAHTGVIYRDVDQAWVNAAAEIYKQTQDYYSKGRTRSTIPSLSRGTSISTTVQSPIESWSADYKSASAFGDNIRTIDAGTIPASRVFMSYKALSDIWSPEKDLKGKKEHVIISEWLWELYNAQNK
jgi:hypothetical protein